MSYYKATYSGAHSFTLPYRCEKCAHEAQAVVRGHGVASTVVTNPHTAHIAGAHVSEQLKGAAYHDALAMLRLTPCPQCQHRNGYASFVQNKAFVLGFWFVAPAVALYFLADWMRSWIVAGTLAVIFGLVWIGLLIGAISDAGRWRGQIEFS